MTTPLVLIITGDPETARTTAEHLTLREEFEPLLQSRLLRPTRQSASDPSISHWSPTILQRASTSRRRSSSCAERASAHQSSSPARVQSEEVLYFQSGANDVVASGVSFAALHARMKAHLRQYLESLEVAVPVGDFVLHPETRTLVDSRGRKVRLTNKEALILRRLYRAGDAAVSRSTLLEEVWGHNTDLTTHTVETHVYRIRQKLDEKDIHSSFINTSDDGYRLLR